MIQKTTPETDHCAVIVTALPVEYAAVRAHLKDIAEDEHLEGDVYERGLFHADERCWQVGIVEIGVGNPNAAQKTERALEYFQPKVVVFVGVAGGIKDVEIGDVVVATKVYGYHSGKSAGEFQTRPEVGLPNHRILERARAEQRKSDWLKRLTPASDRPLRVILGAIAAGEQVLTSMQSEGYELIRRTYNDALAVEMESYGFLKAANARSGLEALIVRGISDLLEGKAEADKLGSQALASRHAAAFAFEVLAKLNLPDRTLRKEFHSTADRVSLDLSTYKEATRKRYSRLKLEELDPTTHDIQPLTLTGMFIAQSARECEEFMPRLFELPKEVQRRLVENVETGDGELDEELVAMHRRVYRDQSPCPILEIVHSPAPKRLVILGDPGSGKSTLLQYLLLEWAMKAAPDLAPDSLPLLIELREYARLRHEGEVDGFLGYLQDGASVRCQLDRTQLHAFLKVNPSLLLFDGLDEVFDPELRKEISAAIHRFADEYPLARVVVTSRIIGYQYQAWRDENFSHFMLQELDETQIADFLHRWHRAAYDDPSKGETKRALLARSIEDSAAIRQLAGNPLLLTMMAILNRTQDLPRDRSELYEQCARLLLHQWKVDIAFDLDPELAKALLDYKDKRRLMLHVARVMQCNERCFAGNLIDEDKLESALAEGLSGMPNLRPARAARALIEQLRGRNFMLCSVGGRFYAFVHRTFLEYFCAVEILERFQTEQSLKLEQLKTDIFGHWANETWHEVLALLAGMLAPRFVGEILEWLLARPDPDELCHHIFLAARCVGEVRRREQLGDVEKQVVIRTQALIGYDFNHYYAPWGEEHATVTGIRAHAVEIVAKYWRKTVDTRDWFKALVQSDEDSVVRQSAVEELARGWKDDPETLPWLKALAQDDDNWVVRPSAVQELARGWKDDPETLPWLKVLAQFDDNWVVRQSAVQELARGWKGEPETLPFLIALVLSDEDSDVRQSAVQELARGWRDDPDTLPILNDLVQFDEDSDVRQCAVQELARGWKDDPGTLPILKALVQPDEDSIVRQSAVMELARGWKGERETLPFLKALAQSDEDSEVRQRALQELARGWKGDPETLPLFKALAQFDVNRAVRRHAVHALARGWRDDPDTLPILKALVQSDEDSHVRQSAVQELARGWRDDPDTLPILKALVQSVEDSDVRQTAVLELARGWRDDPDTLPILKAFVQSDEDSVVRQSVVQGLARGWKDDPDTLPILKALAQCDEGSEVRRRALQELARGWKDDPDTLPILRALAQCDEDSEVRWRALQELTRGWKDDPGTLPILKALMQSDEDSDVRWSAVRELARSWKDDPETLPILNALVQFDEDSDVRQCAVQELARGWKDDPGTLPILKALVQPDEDSVVRQSAVKELARGWKGERETLPFLMALAQSDEDSEVRRRALQELARGWKDDPDVQKILHGIPSLSSSRTSSVAGAVRRSLGYNCD